VIERRVAMSNQLQLRNEVSSYVRACEHLISSATMPGEVKLSVDECQLVDYYVVELSKVTLPSPIDHQLKLF
jgi:hypothetical protein